MTMMNSEPRMIIARASLSLSVPNSSDAPTTLRRFRILAYSGAPMTVRGWELPVVIDLEKLQIPSQSLPIRFNHDGNTGIGHTERIAIEDGQLIAEGVVSRATAAAQEFVASAENGFPWQASVGTTAEIFRLIPENTRVEVNGRELEGPIYLVEKATLMEISVVDLGADINTEVALTAHAGLSFVAGGNLMSDQTPRPQDQMIEAQTQDQSPMEVPAVQAQAIEPQAVEPARYQEDLERFKVIRAIFGQRTDLAEKAIREKWNLEQCQIEALRAERPKGPAIHTRTEPMITAQMLTCALRMQGRDSCVEKEYPAPILEAADQYRSLPLVKLAEICARLDGVDLPIAARPTEIVQAAMSTRTLMNVLKESAQKILLDGYQSIEPAATRVARIFEVPDFKTVTLARLTGQYRLEKVAPDGELPHAEVTDQGFTIRVETFGRLVGLTRQDVINDDLGAFLDLPRQIGRGAALALESTFWSMVEAGNGTFFASGNSNVISGASSAFGIASLNAALAKLRKQTDPAGNPIAARPRFVAVPPDLEADATAIYTSNVLLIAGSSDRTVAQNNPHANKYEPVVSPYLTGSGSSSPWYLVADPADVPAFGIAFLRGQQMPTIEEAEPDPKYLGRLFRGYFDFGVALLDPRGAVRAAGS